MVDKNKEAIKILEENKLTNIHSPEDKIKMEIDRIEVDHTKVDDRGPLDLTRQVDELKRKINFLLKELTDKVRRAEAMRRPLDTMDEIAYRELEKENADLKWDNKSLAKQVEDLKWDNKSLAKQVEDKVEEVKALKMKLEELDSNKD